MLSKDQILRTLKNELPYLKEAFGVKSIGIFGSYVRGTQTQKSDIDLVVEFEKPIGLSFMDFAEYLETLFRRKVDILTSEGIRSIRIKEIAEDIKRSVIYA